VSVTADTRINSSTIDRGDISPLCLLTSSENVGSSAPGSLQSNDATYVSSNETHGSHTGTQIQLYFRRFQST
ncbi:MAG: hypothetical protein ACE1ZA_03470, partial [Pseudomonadales bacterium]